MPSAVAERRSQRIPLDVPLLIKGRIDGEQDFREETFTLSANAHGVLLSLKTSVSVGQKVQLFNRRNWDELEGRVVYVGTQVLPELVLNLSSPPRISGL
jgi:hypothetical protein